MANSNFRTLTLDKLDGVASTRNYIKNGSALQNVKGWATYADAAGTAPVDGTGGSPTVTWTRTTSSPLSLDASFLLTKDAANRQGQGASYDFSIDRADQAKVCRIDFDYEVASGTYADGDLTVWIYDVTNSQLIQPSASSILNAIGPQKKQSLSFQTNSNSTSYRLIIHVASTSASAYTVKFDNISVVRESISQGTVVTDWVSYTPTTAGLGAVSSIVFSWRRVGDSVEILGRLNTGTPTATFATISLPSGLIADTAKISSSGQVVGSVIVNTSITSVGWYLFGTGSSSTLNIGIRATTTTSGFAYANGNAISNSSGDTISLIATVPIQGWSSSQQLSSDAETRVVAASYGMSASSSSTSIAASDTLLDFDTKVFDTHGAVTTGASWKYTAPVPGVYKMRYTVTGTGTTADLALIGSIYKNGVKFREQYREKGNTTSSRVPDFTFEFTIELKAGEYISPYAFSSTSNTIQKSVTYNWIDIERISGPAQIAASEVIAFRASNTAGTSLTGGAGFTDIPFATESFDTHGAFSTPTFTAPAPGLYEFNFNLYTNSVSMTTSQGFTGRYVVTGKSSGNYDGYVAWGNGASIQLRVGSPLLLDMNAGDTVKVQAATDATVALNVSSGRNYFQAKRIS